MSASRKAAQVLAGWIVLGLAVPMGYAAQGAESPANPTKKPALANTTPQTAWIVNCTSVTGQLVCETSQRLTLKKTGQLLLAATVRKPPKATGPTMMLQLPHGIFLPAGVLLKVDKSVEQKEPVQTCDQNGCYVGFPMLNLFLQALIKAKNLSISFQNLEKKQLTINMPLNGFETAYRKMQTSQSR